MCSVCTCACMCVCMCEWVHACVCVCMCVHVSVSVCMCVCMCVVRLAHSQCSSVGRPVVGLRWTTAAATPSADWSTCTAAPPAACREKETHVQTQPLLHNLSITTVEKLWPNYELANTLRATEAPGKFWQKVLWLQNGKNELSLQKPTNQPSQFLSCLSPGTDQHPYLRFHHLQKFAVVRFSLACCCNHQRLLGWV